MTYSVAGERNNGNTDITVHNSSLSRRTKTEPYAAICPIRKCQHVLLKPCMQMENIIDKGLTLR
jgi:hypothetical protein